MLRIFFVFLVCTFSAADIFIPFNNGTLDLQPVSGAVSEAVKNAVNKIADPVVKELLVTMSREFARFSLRLEFFTMATGNHLNIPIPTDGTDLDLEYHEIATAATFFWQRLSFMEVVEEAITNATVEVIQSADDLLEDLSVKNETKMHTILKQVVQHVNLTLSQDPDLQKHYHSLKKKLGAFFRVNRHEMTPDLRRTLTLPPDFYRWFSIPLIKRYVINKIFLIHCMHHQFSAFHKSASDERHLLARSLIRLSKDRRKRVKVQKLYYESLRATADALVSNMTKEADGGRDGSAHGGFLDELAKYSDGITSYLFFVLNDKIKSDPVLKRDVENAQAVIKRNKNAFTSHRIDYWPL